MEQMYMCQKCNGFASIKVHRLCRSCYYKTYSKQALPNKDEIWGEFGPYDKQDNWLEKLCEIKSLPNLYYDENRPAVIFVVRSKQEYKEKANDIRIMKEMFKPLDFDVRDEFGSFITYHHSHYSE